MYFLQINSVDKNPTFIYMNMLYSSRTTDVFCPMLPDPANGVITYLSDIDAPFDYLTTATYSCNVGYGLSDSSSIRICGNTGEWSGVVPECNRKESFVLIDGKIFGNPIFPPDFEFCKHLW